MDKFNLKLSAIKPFIEDNIPNSKETKIPGKNFVIWGDDNKFPTYLYELYSKVSTLQSVINGTSDFVLGEGLEQDVIINSKSETLSTLISKLVVDYLIFGGFAINIIRNYQGEVSELYYVDFSKVRSNERNDVFYYSDDWSKSYGRVKTSLIPVFNSKDTDIASSLFYYKGNKTRSVYPTPLWNASIESCEIEKKINDFHLNAISNGFSGNYVFQFLNGEPTDDIRDEIEKNITEKFAGSENAGRFLLVFNQDAEHKMELQKIESDNLDEKYQALAKRSREQIFIAFRATPNLFGLPTETTGFNEQEFNEAFKLYNKTTISPIQRIFKETFKKILNIDINFISFNLN